MRTSDIFINAAGVYLPELVEAPRTAPDGMTGAAVAGDVPAVEMALHATREALGRWGQDTDLLSLLLYVDSYHTGPTGWCPQSYLQRHAVGGNVLAANFRQGCNGVFGALEMTAGYLRSLPPERAAVIVASDNIDSPLVDRWNALDGFAMGDAATALVLSRTEGFAQLLSVTSTTVPELEGLHRGDEPLHPANILLGHRLDFNARIREFAAHRGFSEDMALHLFKTLQEVVTRAVDEADITLSDITRAAMASEPRPKLIERLRALGLPTDISTWDFNRTVGHSASDQLLAFDHLLRQGELTAGDHLLMIGLGPGLSMAAAIVKVHAVPAWARP
ncbi:ketoacyl-ACP synthase III family protein [Nucisporomicrobium flavum]|uniref:ketoacyl-ACP synthase III family protein n=1 Tax=Nucisporomicrobium flavum TaxID=2785915 RepID=UPI0018F30CD4|nr:ketoacyl-ACP synthase III family protein [Nucisporomicrobium flavum]